MNTCQASSQTTIAPQISQQPIPTIAQSAGRVTIPVPATPPSVWVSDFFWITVAISIFVGVTIDKWHKK